MECMFEHGANRDHVRIVWVFGEYGYERTFQVMIVAVAIRSHYLFYLRIILIGNDFDGEMS